MPTAASQFISVAKACVRARLRDRKDGNGTSISDGRSERGTEDVKKELATLLDIDNAHLRYEDRLRDILRVHRNELPPDTQLLMEKLGLRDLADPFAIDLLHYVEKRIGRDSARLRRPAFLPQPRNEEEWIERVMGMTVADLTAALA